MSWDVTMIGDARRLARRGAARATSSRSPPPTTPSTASWYESMGIMVVWMADGTGRHRPVHRPRSTSQGVLTHGHLPENDNHGGEPDAEALRRRARSCRRAVRRPARSPIADFVYARGDMSIATTVPDGQGRASRSRSTTSTTRSATGSGTRSPRARRRATARPASRTRSPTATVAVRLGRARHAAAPPTAGRVTWSTPTDLPAGTYTYFCRIHPFMRGAFRVAA